MLFLLFISQDTKKHGPYSRRNADYACVFLFLTGCRLKTGMCIYVWGSVTVGVVHGEIPFFDKTLRINVVPIIGERVRESKRQGGFFT